MTARPVAPDVVRAIVDQVWESLLRRAAVAMFAARGDHLTDEDVHDAFGEVVNVIGGNVKGSLQGSTSLGLPVVSPTSTSATTDLAADSHCVVEWQGAPVVVEVHPSPTSSAAPATRGWTTP